MSATHLNPSFTRMIIGDSVFRVTLHFKDKSGRTRDLGFADLDEGKATELRLSEETFKTLFNEVGQSALKGKPLKDVKVIRFSSAGVSVDTGEGPKEALKFDATGNDEAQRAATAWEGFKEKLLESYQEPVITGSLTASRDRVPSGAKTAAGDAPGEVRLTTADLEVPKSLQTQWDAFVTNPDNKDDQKMLKDLCVTTWFAITDALKDANKDGSELIGIRIQIMKSLLGQLTNALEAKGKEIKEIEATYKQCMIRLIAYNQYHEPYHKTDEKDQPAIIENFKGMIKAIFDDSFPIENIDAIIEKAIEDCIKKPDDDNGALDGSPFGGRIC